MSDRKQPTPPPIDQVKPDPPPAPPPHERVLSIESASRTEVIGMIGVSVRQLERRAFMAGHSSGVHGDQDTPQAFEDYMRRSGT